MPSTATQWASGTPTTSQSAGTWATATNATGANNGTYAEWTSGVANSTGTINFGGYNLTSVVPAGSTVDSIDVVAWTQTTNVARILNFSVQLLDNGTPVGTAQSQAATTSNTAYTKNFTGITYSQLATLGVRGVWTHLNNGQSAIGRFDAVGIIVNYTAGGTFSGGATKSGTAVITAGGVVAASTTATLAGTGAIAASGTVGGAGGITVHDITFTSIGSGTTIWNAGMPATTNVGDLLLAFVLADDSQTNIFGNTMSGPIGDLFSELGAGEVRTAAGDVSGYVFYRWVIGGEGGIAQWEWPATLPPAGSVSIVRLSGADTGQTLVHSLVATAAGAVNATVPSVTLSASGSALVLFAGVDESAAPATAYWAAPLATGFTNLQGSASATDGVGGSFTVAGAAYQTGVASGATGTVTANTAGDNDAIIAFLIGIIPSGGGGGSLSGSATRSGTGSITASGSMDAQGAASRAGTGSIGTSGTVGASTGATVAGTGAVAASGTVGKSATATLAGAGSTTAGGQTVSGASASIPGTGSIAGTGSMAAAGGATRTGTGSIAASGAVATSAGASMAGTGAVTTAGTVARSASATVSGTGSVTASGTAVAPGSGSATRSGTGAISASGTVATASGATLGGTGTRTAAGSVGKSTTGTLTGTGSTTASGSVSASAAAAVVGTGSTTASGSVAAGRTAAIPGAGSTTATGTVGVFANATITATAGISASGTVGASAGAAIGGAGSIASVASMAASSGADLAGTGAIVATSVLIGAGEPALNPRVLVHGERGRVSVPPYAGTVRVTRIVGTVSVED